MTQHAESPRGHSAPDRTEFMPACPVCGGRMEKVYSRPHQQVCVCVDCGSDLAVPATAWAVLRHKRGERIS